MITTQVYNGWYRDQNNGERDAMVRHALLYRYPSEKAERVLWGPKIAKKVHLFFQKRYLKNIHLSSFIKVFDLKRGKMYLMYFFFFKTLYITCMRDAYIYR